MSAHLFLDQYLRIAFGCMACDGEIADPEVDCLRSIAVQLGHSAAAVDPALTQVGAEFAADASGTVRNATAELASVGLRPDDATLLMRILVQIAEADGTVHANERRFIQETVDKLGLDRDSLEANHPEWALYLALTLRVGDAAEEEAHWLKRAVEEIPDVSEAIRPRG